MMITASMVNELRKKTQVGMMLCKKALEESNGDMDSAVDWLKKYGAKLGTATPDGDCGSFECTVLKDGSVIDRIVADNGVGFRFTDGHLTVDVKDFSCTEPKSLCSGGFTFVCKGIKRD